jgi:quinoprotein dehydrogenase-associated probable ABC transporter substrate-binding protein
MTIRAGLLRLVGILVGGLPAAALGQAPDLVAPDELRVCADPSNLPYSNDKLEGFENKIADIIGKDLKRPVEYVWYPQSVGFIRQALAKGRCDLVMGTVAGDTDVDTTDPYYHSGYMLVSRQDAGIGTQDIGDPVLADKKIGLIARTPPTDLLLKHNLMDHVIPYALVVDTRVESPPRQMLQDIVDKKIDVGVLWGPIVGYQIKHDHLPLKAVFITPEGTNRMDFHIAMGVRPGEAEWRRRINQAIERHKDEIRRVLVDYGIPFLDEENKPIVPEGPAP